MMTLYDMMQQAQNGQAMANLARQYGLTQRQTQSAVEALLPAFTMGLQRQTHDPHAFGGLAQMMFTQPYGRLYDADGDGIPDNAQATGVNALAQIFGSREVSQAVAAQAAATSGVSQAILKQMLPVIAAMVMGGLSKSMASPTGPFGPFLEMMRGQFGGAAPAPAPQASANPLEAIFGQMFGQAQSPQRGGPPAPGPANPMGDIFGQILTGMLGGAQPQAREPERQPPRRREESEPAATEPTGAGPIGLDALNRMFETGRQVQQSHQTALQDIFDVMLGGQKRR